MHSNLPSFIECKYLVGSPKIEEGKIKEKKFIYNIFFCITPPTPAYSKTKVYNIPAPAVKQSRQ